MFKITKKLVFFSLTADIFCDTITKCFSAAVQWESNCIKITYNEYSFIFVAWLFSHDLNGFFLDIGSGVCRKSLELSEFSGAFRQDEKSFEKFQNTVDKRDMLLYNRCIFYQTLEFLFMEACYEQGKY